MELREPPQEIPIPSFSLDDPVPFRNARSPRCPVFRTSMRSKPPVLIFSHRALQLRHALVYLGATLTVSGSAAACSEACPVLSGHMFPAVSTTAPSRWRTLVCGWPTIASTMMTKQTTAMDLYRGRLFVFVDGALSIGGGLEDLLKSAECMVRKGGSVWSSVLGWAGRDGISGTFRGFIGRRDAVDRRGRGQECVMHSRLRDRVLWADSLELNL